MQREPNLMQTVEWYYTPIEAEIARGLLESHGLTPFLHSINHAWAAWSYCMALGGVQLQVPYWEVEKALEVLSLPEVHNEADTCKSCGSSDTKLIKAKWLVSLFVVHLFWILVPLPFELENRKCCVCGSQWKER
jgi:hypothetical protein